MIFKAITIQIVILVIFFALKENDVSRLIVIMMYMQQISSLRFVNEKFGYQVEKIIQFLDNFDLSLQLGKIGER